MNLYSLLRAQADARPQAAAIIDCTGRSVVTLDFAAFDAAVARAAALLARHGLKAGDPVLLFHPMSADLYVALGAIFRLGLVGVFIDPSMGREHLERCCTLMPPKALLATPKAHLLRLVMPALRRIPLKFATGIGAPGAIAWRHYHDEAPLWSNTPVTSNTPALVTFTSGSTGAPKAAVRTHGFLRSQHEVVEATLQTTPGDVILTTLPIFVLSHLAAGATTLIPSVDIRHPGKVDPASVTAQIRQFGVNCIEASPAFLERVADHCLAAGERVEGVFKIFTGGGPVLPQLLDALRVVAPNAQIDAVYGSTEAEPIAHLSVHELSAADRRAMQQGAGLLAGQPVDAVDVRILRDRWGTAITPRDRAEFDAACLAAGEIGEIVVHGDHVLPGYLHGAGDAETKFKVDGQVWHRTGDAGAFDSEGRLWLMGRCQAKVVDERGALYPFAVEVAAQQHPAVRRAALVQHAGKRMLVVEFKQGRPVEAIQALLAWARIDTVQAIERIPVDRRHNAKVDYRALQTILQDV
ncbi:MAG: AMP-binding protein [Anaerolineales bacterium]|nr:AMP-binding protein [Anaerolineales bacterium]